jgi:hypothetical protein
MIAIQLDDPVVTTGAFVTGRVRWASDGRQAGEIVIAAEWQTAGEGNIARGCARSATFRPRRGQQEAELPFRFMIPFEGPISFETELITMRWMLRVRVRRAGFDEFAETEFRVEPRRRPTSAIEPALPASA